MKNIILFSSPPKKPTAPYRIVYRRQHNERVETYAKLLTSAVSGVAEVGGEAVWLVVPLPLGAATVVVVGEDLVIVDVASG